MDALLVLAAILYAVLSASSQSKKAKKKHDARPKGSNQPLPPFAEVIEQKPKPKRKSTTLFDFPTNPQKAESASSQPAKKKKKKPTVIIAETAPQARKAPITPVKKSEHEHQHKAPVQSRLTNRNYGNIKNKYQSKPLEVQILGDSNIQTPDAAGFKLKTDTKSLVEGIIWNEVLERPKALRK